MASDEPDVARLLAAFAGKRHDRMPHFEICIEAAAVAGIMGWPREKGIHSRYLPPALALEFARRTHQDVIVACVDAWFGERAVSTEADLDRLPPFDPDACRRGLQTYLDAVRGTNIGVAAHMCGPFFVSYMAMGPVPIQSFLLNLYDNPALVERLMEIQSARQLAIWEAIRDLPLAFAIVADDVTMTSGYFCPPSIMQQLWVPHARRLARAVKAAGKPLLWHCCGKLDDVLPLFVEWGVDALNPIQPSCNDIYRIQKQYGRELCLVGNMCIEGVMTFGTPAEVRAETRAHIEGLASGGYVVASSHSIIDSIPLENYYAMTEAAREYGVFR